MMMKMKVLLMTMKMTLLLVSLMMYRMSKSMDQHHSPLLLLSELNEEREEGRIGAWECDWLYVVRGCSLDMYTVILLAITVLFSSLSIHQRGLKARRPARQRESEEKQQEQPSLQVNAWPKCMRTWDDIGTQLPTGLDYNTSIKIVTPSTTTVHHVHSRLIYMPCHEHRAVIETPTQAGHPEMVNTYLLHDKVTGSYNDTLSTTAS